MHEEDHGEYVFLYIVLAALGWAAVVAWLW